MHTAALVTQMIPSSWYSNTSEIGMPGIKILLTTFLQNHYVLKNAFFWDVMRVTLVTADDSEERMALISRVTRIGELGTKLAVTSNRRTLRRNTSSS
jgi:hypothetical protein